MGFMEIPKWVIHLISVSVIKAPQLHSAFAPLPVREMSGVSVIPCKSSRCVVLPPAHCSSVWTFPFKLWGLSKQTDLWPLNLSAKRGAALLPSASQAVVSLSLCLVSAPLCCLPQYRYVASLICTNAASPFIFGAPSHVFNICKWLCEGVWSSL